MSVWNGAGSKRISGLLILLIVLFSLVPANSISFSKVSVRLESYDDGLQQITNIGLILVTPESAPNWQDSYTLAADLQLNPGRYLCSFDAMFMGLDHSLAHLVFVEWQTTGNISVIPPRLQYYWNTERIIVVDGPGTLRAVYRSPALVSTTSLQDNGATTRKGQIYVDRAPIRGGYSDAGRPLYFRGEAAELRWVPGSDIDYEFVRWETTGGVVVSDPNGNPTRVTFNNDGWLKAIYRWGPPVVLRSRDANGASVNKGKIVFDTFLTAASARYSLPTNVTTIATSSYPKVYFIAYEPDPNYAFVRWEIGGNVELSGGDVIPRHLDLEIYGPMLPGSAH